MARMARLVVPGYAHHVTQRGNRRMETFFDEEDYRAYLKLLAVALERTGVACWAYCLMPNHVHLILVPPLAPRPATAERSEGPAPADSLRACLGEAHRRYTRHINFREGWRGHLWQERFHSFVMDAPYLLACARYVEQNPVKAGLVARAEDWPWSSARIHLAGRDEPVCQAAPLLERAEAWQGLDWPSLLAGETSEAVLERFRGQALTGRPLGDGEFLARIESLTGRDLQPRHPGRPRKIEADAQTRSRERQK
jgi:putative transposase